MTTRGARPPGVSAAPTTSEAPRSASSRSGGVDSTVSTAPPTWRLARASRPLITSTRSTRAPNPAAVSAAASPTVPAPITTTLAGGTPATPPRSRPVLRIRSWVPMRMARRPAISLIGSSSGRPPSGPVTVSNPIAVAPEAIRSLVSSGSAARWR